MVSIARDRSPFVFRPPLGLRTKQIADTSLQYDVEDIDNQGCISLMLTPDDPHHLKDLRRAIQRQSMGQVTGKLALVDSLVARVREQDAPAFIRTLPKGTRASVDATIDYPGADDLRPFPRTSGAFSASSPETRLAASVPLPTGPIDVDRLVVGMDKVWAAGYTGRGMTGAVLDSGIYPHEDLRTKIKAFKDIADGQTAPYDKYGHGTNVAGIMVGDGTASHGIVKGEAPDASVVGVRITTVAEAIQGLQWIIDNKDKYGIRVVNMSLGDTATTSFKTDLWAQACEKAIAAGLLVVVAAGNEGPSPGSISTPGIDPNVITVGNLDDHKQADFSKFSPAGDTSVGPTTPDGVLKPDVLAPGEYVYGPLAPNSVKDAPDVPHYLNKYIALHGSSQATPMVSGLLLCLKQAYPQLTQAQAMQILDDTARPLPGVDKSVQGHGVIDGWAALQAVLALKKQNQAA